MAATIYFSETRDFKIIRDQIIEETNEYLVYVYADTKNIKIPKDLIKDLPIFGNNIVWVNSSDMDSSQIINHVALTIGQFLNTEDPISFVIASRTSRYDKAISLFRSQNVSVEQIGVSVAEPAEKKSGKRGRPKGSKIITAKSVSVEVDASAEAPKKKRGRPRKIKVEEPATDPKPKKKRGRPAKVKTTADVTVAPKKRGRPAKVKTTADVTVAPKKSGRPKKEEKPVKKARKQRKDKPVSSEMIEASLAKFPSNDNNVIQIQKLVFGLRKVQRPKYDQKLSLLIQKELSVEEDNALAVIQQMKDTGMMDNSGKSNRLMYKD